MLILIMMSVINLFVVAIRNMIDKFPIAIIEAVKNALKNSGLN